MSTQAMTRCTVTVACNTASPQENGLASSPEQQYTVEHFKDRVPWLVHNHHCHKARGGDAFKSAENVLTDGSIKTCLM